MPAIGTSRNTSGMVSIITPTYNRATFLKNALAYFRSQNYRDIEWLILDDSLQEAPAFSDLADRNIFYERIDRKLSVGEKRNLLIDKSHGEKRDGSRGMSELTIFRVAFAPGDD
jgi:glycosyltransferase involved in cell wall biosynthesis